MKQDDVFVAGEGDAWFSRNREALTGSAKIDWPIQLVDMLDARREIKSVIELGCANGWRLNRLSEMLQARFVGVDASREAVADGKARFPALTLLQGTLADVPVQEAFDLTIVNFVLHWVDRRSLARSVAEIDRVTRDGGFLIVGDFLPDNPQRRRYHHLPAEQVYTYKQDYAKIFESLGTYRTIARIAFDHDSPTLQLHSGAGAARGGCAVLKKSLVGYYQET